MIRNNIRLIVGLIVGFVVAFFTAKSLLHEPKAIVTEGNKTVVVRLVTKIDTLFINKNIVVHDTIEKPTLVQVVDTVRDNTHTIVTIPAIRRVYQDSTKVEDSVYIGYRAKTTGTLDNITLSYSNRKSIMVIHKQDSIFTNTTITKPSRGLYLGVNAGVQEVSPTLQYNVGNNVYGVKYNLINQGVGITYSRKIF